MKPYLGRALGILMLCLPLKFSIGSLPASESKLTTNNFFAGGEVYNQLHLRELNLEESVFNNAIRQYSRIANAQDNNSLLTIIDFSQSSNAKRLYIIDLKSRQLILQTYVAHGRNSGDEFAKHFSNIPESYMSSPGLYTTGHTYTGKHGLSLQLIGLDKGVNDNAAQRSIVFHGAPYVSEEFIRKYGRLGRSQGCPAVSEDLSAFVINLIKDGSCVYMYAPVV